MAIHAPSAPSIKHLDSTAEFFIDEGCFVIENTTTDEDPLLSIARCRVTPGNTTRWHRLHNVTERYVVHTGEGLVEVGDLPPTRVKPGDTVVIPPGCRQRIRNTGATDLVFLALCTPRFTPACYEDIHDDIASAHTPTATP